MTTSEPKFLIRFTWPMDEADVWCCAVPRLGERVVLPGNHKLHVVVEVRHMLTKNPNGDGSLWSIIAVDLAPLSTLPTGAAENAP